MCIRDRGEVKGEGELVARWQAAFLPDSRLRGELDEARELLAALGKIRSRNAVPLLVRSLEDIRLRPHVVEALGEIGDMRAKEPLLRVFGEERYVHLRPLEARVLFKLGAREKLYVPLARFAGTPEPMAEALGIARDAKILTPDRGGLTFASAATATGRVKSSRSGAARLFVLIGPAGGSLSGVVGGAPLPDAEALTRELLIVELPDVRTGDVSFSLTSPAGIQAVWLVPRAPEVPPPPPRTWDAGIPAEDDPLAAPPDP